MEVKDYCSKVCKGKCCYQRLSDEPGHVRCNHLNNASLCNVYDLRFNNMQPDVVVVGYYKSKTYITLFGNTATRPFYCGRITNLIKEGLLPKDIEAQCCIAHPELLKEKKENEDISRKE